MTSVFDLLFCFFDNLLGVNVWLFIIIVVVLLGTIAEGGVFGSEALLSQVFLL